MGGFTNTSNIKSYLTKYYKLLHNYYNINMLKINSDKTKLMLGYNKKYKNELEHFYFFANNDKIVNQKSLKILGFTLRCDNNMETQIGNLCANLHFRINNIRKLNKFTNFSSRLVFIKSLVIGKLIYAMPMYTQLTLKQINKIHKVIMASARVAIGNYCFKKTIKYILEKCKILGAKEMIAYSSILFIHKIILNKKPNSNFNRYMPFNSRQTDKKIRTKYRPKTKKFKNHIINKGAELLNNIPNDIRNMSISKFKKQLKKYLTISNVWEP